MIITWWSNPLGTFLRGNTKGPAGNYLPVIYAIGQPYGTQPGDNPQIPTTWGRIPMRRISTWFPPMAANLRHTVYLRPKYRPRASRGLLTNIAYVAQNTWVTNGTWTNATSIDGMFVTTNGNGGAYIFYTTGNGGAAETRDRSSDGHERMEPAHQHHFQQRDLYHVQQMLRLKV